ncbi:endonuclease/exonuclease/phosphatase family protein [Lacipirellula sp.]|uniref:endonuclease/exonuclease/phosphatase family protein n=1 Tax=Lacipirellula sp. TaxID=2691419 RepID=UPI003D0E979D
MDLLQRILCTVAIAIVSLHQADAAPIQLRVCAWNVESGDADTDHISERIKKQEKVDVWGLSEVQNDDDAEQFETAAEAGESADFKRIVGTTGGSDRLVIIYNADRLKLDSTEELHPMNIGGNVRAPLVATFSGKTTGKKFLFVVNHLYRGSASGRHTQSERLNSWARQQALPVITVGDFNYDFHFVTGDVDHDEGFDLLCEDGVFSWVRPETLVPTNASGHKSVLDFVFVSGDAAGWTYKSSILQEQGDFPDDAVKSDHRPIDAIFTFDSQSPSAPVPAEAAASDGAEHDSAALLQRIEKLEKELEELRGLLEQSNDDE